MSQEQMLILGAVLYLILMTAYSISYSYRVANWPFVIGSLEGAVVKTANGMELGRKYEKVNYEYEVDGQKYSGDRLSPLMFRGQVGRIIEKQIAKIEYVSENRVKVFYDPQKPNKSYLVRESWLDIFRS